MKRRTIIAALAVATTTLTAGAYYGRNDDTAPSIVTGRITRGSIVDTVAATGTLEAVTTVQVGSQLSGAVQELNVDFNAIVRKGQVVARLEPSLYQTQVEQARANLLRTEADAERLNVAVLDATTKLERARQLSERKLIPTVDLETADVARRSAEAQLRSGQAQITQARASLTQAEVNLEKTVITAPIDGIVIARNVDVGQTVAASLQAPTLYVIAADLTRMRVSASIDESEIGRVRPGQTATFRVDAFPNDEFTGTVSQVRLNPVVAQNVVTYVGMIDVSNPDLKLKPGMTATVAIEVDRRDDVLRAPAAALRFRPTAEVLAALGQVSPAGNERRDTTGATRRLWVEAQGTLAPHDVTPGLTDGAFTEIVDSTLSEGTAVVTSVALTAGQGSATTSPASNPFMGMQPGPPGGFGGRGGAGAGGAR